MNPSNDLPVVLRVNDKRTTPAKLLIFNTLNNHEAITTTELYLKVATHMDRATYYRIIKEFKQLKIIKDTVINGARKIELSEQFSAHHHHMLCVKCGDVTKINDMKLEQYLKLLAARKGYEHRSHSFEIQGICPACSSRYKRLAKESTAINHDLGAGHIAGHIRGQE